MGREYFILEKMGLIVILKIIGIQILLKPGDLDIPPIVYTVLLKCISNDYKMLLKTQVENFLVIILT